MLGCISSTVCVAAESGWQPWCRFMGRQAWASWPLEGTHGACCRLCSPGCADALHRLAPCMQCAAMPAACGTCHARLLRGPHHVLSHRDWWPPTAPAESSLSTPRMMEAGPAAKWLQAGSLSPDVDLLAGCSAEAWQTHASCLLRLLHMLAEAVDLQAGPCQAVLHAGSPAPD